MYCSEIQNDIVFVHGLRERDGMHLASTRNCAGRRGERACWRGGRAWRAGVADKVLRRVKRARVSHWRAAAERTSVAAERERERGPCKESEQTRANSPATCEPATGQGKDKEPQGGGRARFGPAAGNCNSACTSSRSPVIDRPRRIVDMYAVCCRWDSPMLETVYQTTRGSCRVFEHWLSFLTLRACRLIQDNGRRSCTWQGVAGCELLRAKIAIVESCRGGG